MRKLFYLAITPHTCNQLCDRRQNMQETPQQYTQRMLGYVNGKETTEADQAPKQEAVGTATSTREVVNRSNHGTLSRCRTGGRLAHAFSSRQ